MVGICTMILQGAAFRKAVNGCGKTGAFIDAGGSREISMFPNEGRTSAARAAALLRSSPWFYVGALRSIFGWPR
jgi:hypothetical protein